MRVLIPAVAMLVLIGAMFVGGSEPWYLDPIESEYAPLIQMDPPIPDEIMRSLPDEGEIGVSAAAILGLTIESWRSESH
jgi:hypothetical protein